MALKADSAVPMYRQLAAQIRARIVSGELGDGDRLPSEAQFGERHGVSRVTVRQALADLERDGLLERAPGKGTFVRAPRQPLQGLTRLSGFSEHARAAGMAAGYRVVRVGEERAPVEVARRLGLEERTAYVVERVLLANGRPVGMHASWLPPWLTREARPGALSADALANGSLYAAIEGAGIEIERAEERLEPALADAAQAEALGVEPGTLVQRVQRTVWDREPRPVIVESDTYLPEAYTYRVELYRSREAPAGANGHHGRGFSS